jgi:predicted O-methyltransferase YrrM
MENDKGNFDEYKYSADWFSVNIPTWDKLLEQLKPKRLLEIGSYEGRSTCYLIEKLAYQYPIEIYCIDTWEDGIAYDKNTSYQGMSEIEKSFDFNIGVAKNNVGNLASVTKYKGFSVKALSRLVSLDEPPVFDFIYIDGSHRATDVLIDAVLSFQLLRVGGFLIFDDYLWTTDTLGEQDPLNMPKTAIDAFVNIFIRKIRIISGTPIYQLYLEKTS